MINVSDDHGPVGGRARARAAKRLPVGEFLPVPVRAASSARAATDAHPASSPLGVGWMTMRLDPSPLRHTCCPQSAPFCRRGACGNPSTPVYASPRGIGCSLGSSVWPAPPAGFRSRQRLYTRIIVR